MTEDNQQQGPTAFLAVFFDDRGSVQLGAQMMEKDFVLWERMLTIALEQVRLKQYMTAKQAYESKQQPSNLITPQR